MSLQFTTLLLIVLLLVLPACRPATDALGHTMPTSKATLLETPTLHATLIVTIQPTSTSTSPKTSVLRIPPTPTRISVPTPTFTPTPSPTLIPSATPKLAVIKPIISAAEQTVTVSLAISNTPTPLTPIAPGRLWPTPDVSQAQPHYWLARPFGPDARQWASPYYPYGSTAQGHYLLHHGVDFPNPEGTPILAIAEGEIIVAGDDHTQPQGPYANFYGNVVVQRVARTYRGLPLFVLYGHLSRIDVQVGQQVRPGQPIGLVGQTGIALGPHLHMEVRLGKNDYSSTRNPELWLVPLPGWGTLIGRLLTADGRTWPDVPILIYRLPDEDKIWTQIFTYVDDPDIHPDDEWG
ncbi:MAG TPA: M23 family metallopeptidase, partial [Anaerolineae bacterium]|nr:M23 family metallopeptidase [Anaerolineae bacterium]